MVLNLSPPSSQMPRLQVIHIEPHGLQVIVNYGLLRLFAIAIKREKCLLSQAIVLQSVQHRIHQFEVPTFLKVVLCAEGHVLDLLLLLADRCKVVEDDLKLPLVSECSEFLDGLPLIGPLLIADPPLRERVLEYADALPLQDSHHLGLDVCLRLLRVMIAH